MMGSNMIGRSGSGNGVFKTEAIGQHIITLIANLCFALFVVGVLIFTVLAATYQPEDPWLQPSKTITTFLTASSNATFRSDDSVLRTGEDFTQISPAASMVQSTASINISEIPLVSEAAELVCDQNDPSIDCSKNEVLAAIMRFAIENFDGINFFRFGKPVRGSNESTCDVSWRFQPKNGKATVFYKDYRSFSLKRSDLYPCNYTVMGVGEWHSGKNARRRKQKAGFEPERVKRLPEVPTVGEAVNDSLPVVKSEDTFKMGKYLLYSRGGDHCKGMSQYLWSLLCALGEAQYLNRTFVMDLDICLSGSNNPGHQDEEGKDFRFYFDFEHLKESSSVMEQSQFWQDWKKWRRRDGLSLNIVDDIKTTPMQLREDHSTLIWRRFGTVEPDNYWYRVCEGETENAIQRPWHLIWKSKRLMEIVSAISTRMNWDFDAVHVVRGEKAKNTDLWPNLAQDTSPDTLLAKLRQRIDEGRDVYIATNEMENGFFDRLKETYKLHFLDEFSDLWSEKSEWYTETSALNNGKPVEFDGYMRVEVDTEVFFRGKKQIETFGDLTKDCKDGVGTCSS
eukprot:Gb_07372 [translate_table: standard]